MNNRLFNWLIFSALAFIWGSSFILMKEGLIKLNAFEVASIRIVTAGVVLLPLAIKYFSRIPKNKLFIIFMSGVQGSLLPAYLFCLAEEGIDSALAGTLNALTPVFVIITGLLFFATRFSGNKVAGVSVSLAGSVLLFLAQPGFHQESHASEIMYVIIATIMYGINVNMVGKYLREIPSIHIASLALSLIAIPAAIVLYFTGFFNHDFSATGMFSSIFYSAVLGVLSTTVASIIFYMLIKRAGAVFASMVTYAIPAVALMWGFLYGEVIGWKQIGCLAIILSGVYIANRANKQVIAD